MLITSLKNPHIVQLKKQSQEKSWLCLDTPKLISEAINANIVINELLIDADKQDNYKELINRANCQVTLVTESIIKSFSSVITNAGIIAFIHYTSPLPELPKTNFLVLDSLQDPGNIGTLLRTALGCDFKYVFCLDCVKLSSEKVVRSSMGAIFKLNAFEMSKDKFIGFAKENKINLICADMNGENIFNYNDNDIVGVVIGNEGSGVSSQIFDICSKTVALPMKNGLESLNASVSGSVIMYQITFGGRN